GANYRQAGWGYVLKAKQNEKGGWESAWVLDSNASWEQPGFEQSDDHPVVCVDWNEARAFCEWLSKKEGRTYRLPTDGEWSAAGGVGKYPWGNDWPPPKGVGNLFEEAAARAMGGGAIVSKGYDDGAAHTSVVASYAENRLGIYDLSGNVWEWCEDAYK